MRVCGIGMANIPVAGLTMDGENFLGSLRGDLLDVHATGGRGHEGDARA